MGKKPTRAQMGRNRAPSKLAKLKKRFLALSTPQKAAVVFAAVTLLAFGYWFMFGPKAPRVPKVKIKKLTAAERREKLKEYEKNKAARLARLDPEAQEHMSKAEQAQIQEDQMRRASQRKAAKGKVADPRHTAAQKQQSKAMTCPEKDELTDCVSCSNTKGCAWCINLNKCMDDKPMACRDKFRGDALDHVGYNGKGKCGVIFRSMMYHSHPDQEPMYTCELKEQLGIENENGCCGDGVCDLLETKHSCEEDCASARQRRRIYKVKRQKNTHLFEKLKSVEHPAYHCHEAYEKKMDVQWYLGRPSKDLEKEIGTGRYIKLEQGAEVLDIGCGDGRDTLYLAQQGFRATGVDIGKEPIYKAKKTAKQRGLDNVEFLSYDVLQLPKPQVPIELIWDNTIYCNLRLEYLDDVLALLERITSTGTWYVLNCGNANDFELVRGHPRLKEDVMRRELGGLFEFVHVYEGVYDMKFSGSLAKMASKWHKAHGGVKSWTMLMRRK